MSRDKNWNPEETVQLCYSWIAVRKDIGSKRKRTSFWLSVLEHFKASVEATTESNTCSNVHRTQRALMHRWNSVCSKVPKFCKYYSYVTSLAFNENKSQNDIISEALKMYSKFEATQFEMLYCWHILKESPNWMEKYAQAPSNNPKITPSQQAVDCRSHLCCAVSQLTFFVRFLNISGWSISTKCPCLTSLGFVESKEKELHATRRNYCFSIR